MNDSRHGKQNNQKLKPYLVLQYLLKNTDESHFATAPQIIDFLDECGIYAERRSIYRDIEDINKINYVLENECDIEEAAAALAANEEEKLVVYDKSKRGFYVRQRHFDFDDIRLLAECVYSAKFISDGHAERLVDVVCEFVSSYQAERIKHSALLLDRVKTSNKSVLANISAINEAMSRSPKHAPEKISFKYLKQIINKDQTERRGGEPYIVSPFKLIISDGNYYLLAFDSRSRQIRTYRVDRMKSVTLLGEPREGEEEFAALDVESYAQRTFSMFGGETERVTIRFVNSLLDTVADRFGKETDVIYQKADESHFTINVKVAVSEQFFSWLCSFGKRARLVSPDRVVEQFTDFLDKVRGMYNAPK